MKVIVEQNLTESAHELTQMRIDVPDLKRAFLLDLDLSSIIDRSWTAHIRALDFLIIASVAYAVDKIVPRKDTEDRWTRQLDVTIPLREPASWTPASGALAASLSFLTGDIWSFTFIEAPQGFQKRRLNRRKSAKGYPRSPVVSLLSGGLDSFIGALDLLAQYPEGKLMFISHYDRHVSGPASDQNSLRSFLESKFFGRISHLQVRVGVVPENKDEKYKFETSFRSRSLIFLGLAAYGAAKIGADIPIIIPENGPIALNLPLNPSRRGACSTRTVHPFFLSSLQEALKIGGINNPIVNPYALKTKGEMVAECQFPDHLKQAYDRSNSCGKAGRKNHWANRRASACGACVPCLFRRASLHAVNLDTEVFGNDVFAGSPNQYPDFHALLGLIRTNPSEYEIGKALLANGRLPIYELSGYSGVVRRMLDEVTTWLVAKGSPKALKLAGIKRKP